MNTLAPASVLAAAPGWFGKLSCLGDFAGRRLPAAFQRECDHWLSRGVEASRAQLGDQWLDAYLTSPLWRFAWAPGVVDTQWWLGVVMPSVDNVGRYFPLLVALPRSHTPQGGADLDALEHWYAEVAQAALGTLQAGATLVGFESELHAAVPLVDRAPMAAPPEAQQWTNRTAYRLTANQAADQAAGHAADHTLRDAMHNLAHHDAVQRLHGRTLWWPLRPSGGDNRLTVATGLPAPESFADLLQGEW